MISPKLLSPVDTTLTSRCDVIPLSAHFRVVSAGSCFPRSSDHWWQFSFNKTPLARDMDEAFRVACFEQCPSRGALREKDQPAASRCHQIDIEDDSDI